MSGNAIRHRYHPRILLRNEHIPCQQSTVHLLKGSSERLCYHFPCSNDLQNEGLTYKTLASIHVCCVKTVVVTSNSP